MSSDAIELSSVKEEISEEEHKKGLIRRFLDYLNEKDYFVAWVVLSTIFYELGECFKYAFRAIRDIYIIERKLNDINGLYGDHDVVTHMVGFSRDAQQQLCT